MRVLRLILAVLVVAGFIAFMIVAGGWQPLLIGGAMAAGMMWATNEIIGAFFS